MAKELLAQVRAWRQSNGWSLLQDFVELLSMPNVASDGVNIRRNAEAIRSQLEERGVPPEHIHTESFGPQGTPRAEV